MNLDPVSSHRSLFPLSKSEIVHGRSRVEQQEPTTDESNHFESGPLTKKSILNIVQRAEQSAATYGFAGGAVSTAVIFAAMMSLRSMIAYDAAKHNIPPSQGFVQNAL